MTQPSKEELRQAMRRRLAALDRESFSAEGRRAALLLRRDPLWDAYPTVLLFLSMDNEIDTAPLLEAALGDHKKVFVPRVSPAGLCFFRVPSPAGPWREGAYRIREPAWPDPEALGPGDFPALILTPGLAFDSLGNRLGRGGGFYDRFFASLETAGKRPRLAVGLCLESQIVPQAPVQDEDRRVDALCTGSRLLRILPTPQ
jgi:5-formyltetrahydrofolate cyclo-ligase